MTYRRIMVGTDGSERARRAEAAARRVAKRLDAELTVAHALEQPGKRRSEVLRRAEEEARAEGLEIVTAAPKGKPVPALLEAADRRDVELIVVGSLGMRGARRLAFGSVPDTISHDASCDVLIVQTSHHREPGRYERVLIATDGTPTADRACRRGASFASDLGAEIALVYVGHEVTGRNVLEDTARQLEVDVPVTTHVAQGNAADGILAASAGGKADLIVVGSRGMAGPKRVALGAVPNRVSHKAMTDVLLVKTYLMALRDVQPGEGAIVDDDGRKLAVSRDEDGTSYILSAKCRHLGCTVQWNSSDRTWDCPCHGSRYAHDGVLLQGPATEPLPQVEPTAP